MKPSVCRLGAMYSPRACASFHSARDIQAWEYQPLGPFQAKATATTISPWIVMKAALEPFRTATPAREKPLLPHLSEPRPLLYDIALEVGLTPEGGEETIIARTNYAQTLTAGGDGEGGRGAFGHADRRWLSTDCRCADYSE